MDSLIYKINLDCLRKDSQAIVNAKIGEASGRKIVFTLYEGRAPFFVPSDTTVVFRAKKPSGAVLYNNCVVDDGKIEYTITSQTVAEKGVFPCEIQIIGADNKVIYTPCITLNVTENLYSDTEVESSNEFTELENALNKIPPLEVINSKYTKPEGGIPKSDLANDVQASLNKADTALQEHQSLAAYRTASEQDIIDSTKQDKLTAGENITITENGTISSTGGGAKAFFLNVFVITETQVVTNKTYAEIKAAIDAGDIIYITDKNDVVYMPQVAKTGSKIEFLWLDTQDDRTYRWSAVVNSENAWSVTFPELATTDKLGNLAALKTQAADNLVAAINEVKQTADTKQDKLIAGANITIAADGKTISATGGSGSTIELDTTLSETGKAADAKATGDALAGKQDTISDLETIRSGAAKGATALQAVPSTYRTALAQDVIDSDLSDRIEVIEGKEAGWDGKYTKPTNGIPKTDLASTVQASLGKADTALQSVPNTYRTASEQDTIDSGKVDKVTGKGLSSNDYTDAAKAKVDSLAPVATSGSYNDLADKPTIPTEVAPLIGTTNELTPTQVYEAVSAGIPVIVHYLDDTFGTLTYTSFAIAENMNTMAAALIAVYGVNYVLGELLGDKSNNSWLFFSTALAQKTDIPSALPNPNALTFTGAVTDTYNGSEALNVHIPSDVTDAEIITAPVYTNQIPISTDTAGSVYNGVGYKSGYYLESNGSEVAGGNTLVTGFIPVKKGDIIRIKDASIDETLMIALYPSSKATSNNIGKTIANIKSGTAYGSITTSGGEIVWDTSTIGYYFWNNFAYMRATILSSNAIITVNEQIINTMTESKILKPDIKVKKGNLAFPVMSPMLSGKNVVFFGDSIFGMTRDSTSVAAYASQFTGATISNVGFGGCRMAVHPTSGYAAFSMWALADAVSNGTFTAQENQAASGEDYFSEQLAILKSINFSKVDMIVIHYGTNDFTGNVTIDNADDDDDTTTLCGALRYSLRKIQTAYPKIRIFVSLPIYRKWNDTGAETYTNSSGKKLWDFCTALAGVASEFNCPIINGYKALGINSTNNSAFSADGTHLNDHGRKVFGEYIGGCLIAPSGSAS